MLGVEFNALFLLCGHTILLNIYLSALRTCCYKTNSPKAKKQTQQKKTTRNPQHIIISTYIFVLLIIHHVYSKDVSDAGTMRY